MTAVAESTNVTVSARARLHGLARSADVPVTVLRFDVDLDMLLQHAARGSGEATAETVRRYAAIMRQEAGSDRLLTEGASAVHCVPGCGRTVSAGEAAALYAFL